MPLRNVQKVTAYIMAALGLTLLCFSGELSLPAIVIVIAAFAGSWWAEEPLIATNRWGQAWNAVTVIVFIIQFIRWWTGLGFVTSAVQFAAFLQINKLYNRRSQTDYDHILVLSLLHLIGSSILFSDIEYAILFVFYVIITPWHLMLGQIRREVEAKYLEKKDAESIYNFKRVLKSKRLISGKLLMVTALMSIPIYFLTALFFLFFPRIGFGLLANQSKFARQSVGFSDTIVLGDLVPLADNPLAVARVEFGDPKPDKGDLSAIHWRATAYDRYDGTQWLRTLSFGASLNVMGNYYELTESSETAPDIKKSYYPLEITLLPIYPKALLIPQQTPYVEMAYRQPFRIIRQRLTWGPSHEIRYSDPFDAGISYRVWMSKDFLTADPSSPFRFSEPDPEKGLAGYLQIPRLSGQFKTLSDDFARKYPDPLARAMAIQSWLMGSFRYTRSEFKKTSKGKSPVDSFLFDWKQGNCEFYSTSMALLLRAGGIPSRNVAGFLGGQWNGIGKYLIIREGDAHSWVEAYIPGRGWLIFDPTPPGASHDFVKNRLLSTMMLFFDIMSLAWQKHVIAYDLSRQSKFIRTGFVTLMRWHNTAASLRKKGIHYTFGPAQKRILYVLLMLLAWLVYFYALRRDTILSTPISYRQSVSIRKAVNLLSILDRRLELLGLQRPPSRPPLLHTHLITPQVRQTGTLTDIVIIYNEARYGGRFLDPRDYRALVQKIRMLD